MSLSADGPTRTEHDSLGEVEVAQDALWGAQTQRSTHFFRIGEHPFPTRFIHAFALVKKAAAMANRDLGKLDSERLDLISRACDEVIEGRHDAQFPLSVWQTGSGTQTNMNLNEVIANRANELAGLPRGHYGQVHPNDHVNMSQSSNDVFPTVMHVVALRELRKLLDSLRQLCSTLKHREEEFSGLVKSGRTHMMDATPITLGQEFSGFRAQLESSHMQLLAAQTGLCQLAIGGSAVGTGMNTPPGWAETVCSLIARLSGLPFEPAPSRFMALAGHDALVDLHGRLNTLATALFKLGNDIRLMNSGPRCGLAEIRIPANEPGSSIMPGKVNPTQAEALTMVCARVMGNQTTVSIAGSQGQFQLNVFKPVIIDTVMESLRLLNDAMCSFDQHCLRGLQANREQLEYYVSRSLMLVTALSPIIGYEKAAQVARYADDRQITLREAVVALQLMSAEEFDSHVDIQAMLGPSAQKHTQEGGG